MKSEVIEKNKTENQLSALPSRIGNRLLDTTYQYQTDQVSDPKSLSIGGTMEQRIKAVKQCNEVLLKATSESELFQEMCSIVVKTGGYRLAWVGLVESDDSKSITPVSSCGYEDGYLTTLRITYDNTERGKGPTGQAIRTGQPSVCQHITSDKRLLPWRDDALRRGYASSVAIPLKSEDHAFGAFNLYASEPEAFDVDEIQMLTLLANNIAYRASNLRVNRAKRKLTQQQDLMGKTLEIINRQLETEDCIAGILSGIREQSRIEAVGIRIKVGEDFPYYKTSGFPEQFVKAEMSLCSVDNGGNIKRDAKGSVCLKCMCGNIIRGRTNPDSPFFTRGGSFWTNGTTQRLTSIPEKYRQALTKNRCNAEGFESVALIPLRSGDEIIGLLQLNDRRKNVFTKEDIQFFENLGNSIGIAIERSRNEKHLRQRTHDLGERIKELNCLYSVSQLKMNPNLCVNEVIQGIVDIIPPSWQYPGVTCARVTLGEDVFTTDNFTESLWKQSADIRVAGVVEGKVEVYYTEEMPELAEGPFLNEERALINALGEAVGLFIEKKRADDRLRATNLRLIAESHALRESNIALKEVLASIETDKKESLLRVQANVDRIIMPLVKKLNIGTTDVQAGYLQLLEVNLLEITSPFVTKLETLFGRLTPREVEVCRMLTNGMTSKEIAATFNTSEGTVFNQRKTIRKKLGIAHDNINLVSFLKTI